MWRISLRNLLARKLRLAMSAFAIVLGVAFVAGSFVFTDSLGGAFDGIVKGPWTIQIGQTSQTNGSLSWKVLRWKIIVLRSLIVVTS